MDFKQNRLIMNEYNTIINLIILSVLSGFTGFTIAKFIYKKEKK